ncbi:MAG: hypothetical protein RSA70_07195, partial [Clostridia bacterium]
MKRFIAITLALTLLLSQAAVAINIPWLVKNYPDKHFDLSVEPNRVATVEEFIAIVSVYSYFSKGVDNAALWTDKNGRTPSKWCARYVKAEMDKGLFEPSEIAYDAPVTVAFAAKYLSGCKGKYHWDFENEYSFQNTSSLSAEERMYLNVAVDNKLIPYRTNMNAMMQIKRADLLKYLIPAGTLPNVKSPKVTPNNSMKELHAYFADSYWEDEKAYAQLDELKKHADDFTMVSFHAAYLGDSSALVTTNYDRAPFKDAIAFCNDNGILPLMSITNFVNG